MASLAVIASQAFLVACIALWLTSIERHGTVLTVHHGHDSTSDRGAAAPELVKTAAPATSWQAFVDVGDTTGSGRPLSVVMPLPDNGFDPTEAAVVWKTLVARGVAVTFATESGVAAAADPHVLTGFFAGTLMKVQPHALTLYQEMLQDAAFLAPVTWEGVDVTAFDGLLLTGGHHPGMIPYLASPVVMRMVQQALASDTMVVGGICHGVLLPARASTLPTHVRATTAVPAWLEAQGYYLTRYLAGMHTYQLSTTWPLYVEDEVAAACDGCFVRGPVDPLAPLTPGGPTSHAHAFVVRDGRYISARFWGDAYLYGQVVVETLFETAAAAAA